MTIDHVISGLIYLICSYVLFYVGAFAYQKLHPKYSVDQELFKKDNLALAIALVGYYFGLIMGIGGAVIGPSRGLLWDIIEIFVDGALAIVLMNVSSFINDWFILYRFNIFKEIIDDHNSGTGAIVGAVYLSTGLIIFGSFSGDGGSIFTAIVFWFLGQMVLAVSCLIYSIFSPYKIRQEIEKENVAAGVAFAGALLGIGNVLRVATSVDFTSWYRSLQIFIVYSVVALILLPIIRRLTDWILVPGETLSHEIAGQEKPNLGAAFIEAFSYLGASFLIGWSI